MNGATQREALIVQGGWDGHEPAQVGELFRQVLEREGFAVTVSANCSGRRSSRARSPDGPAKDVPSASSAEASIGFPPSATRQRPVASKFSSDSPSGSIRT